MTDEFPSPRIADSRRLTGANLYDSRPGAVLEVRTNDQRLLAAWRSAVGTLTSVLGWPNTQVVIRTDRDGANLFLTAPIDALLAATEVAEQAWVAAERGTLDAGVVEHLVRIIAAERASRMNVASVHAAATERGLVASFDDEMLTLGAGRGSRSWPVGEVPPASGVAWQEIHNIPIAIVTGSNGKTTTTRLVAAMCAAAGHTPGWTCSDGVWIGDQQIESGDYSGPGGARAVLRDARVSAAILETARGGILRRGLAVQRAAAAIITNVSDDHFGEYGIANERELFEVKGVVAKVLSDDGQLVLNADDPLLASLGPGLHANRAWFSTSHSHAALDAHVAAGGDAATVHDGRLMLHSRDAWHDLGRVNEMPITLGGAAAHNVANVLGASLLAAALGIAPKVIAGALASFGTSVSDNPGRLQRYDVGGATVLVDYAHNPDGLATLIETSATLPAKRRLLLLGQAGNRDDAQVRALARTATAGAAFDHIVVKDMPVLLRGRAAGDVPRVLASELSNAGVPAAQVEIVDGELNALRRALSWARPGDLLVCPIHAEKDAVLALLGELAALNWVAGTPLPNQ